METTRTRDLDLAGQRTAKGIALSWIESSTRISLHFLRAIEAEQFDQLPGGVYAVSYLRQYAKQTGFDEAALLRRYREKMKPESPAEPVSQQVWFLRWLFDRESRRDYFRLGKTNHA